MEIVNAEYVDYTISSIHKAYAAMASLPATEQFPNPALEAARFMVTGYNARESTRARIEPLHHALTASSDIPVSFRDLDSLIGFTDHIPLKEELYVYALANPRDQLTKKVGVLVKFTLPHAKKIVWLDPACIPHVSLARFQQFHMVRILFPGLYERRCKVGNFSTDLTDTELASVYNEGIRPAVEDVLKSCLHEWPASYSAEVFRSRYHSKGFVNSTRAIPANKVYEFGESLKYHLSKNLPWARNLVIQTQVRGVKLAYRHHCTPEDARKALASLLRPMDTRSGTWWIDIGLEYLDYGRALLWRADAAHHLIAAALEMSIHTAGDMTSTRRMQVDPASHFTSIAGFRLGIQHAEDGGKYESPFIQAYTTDKQVTYNPQKGYYGKFIIPKMAMEGVPPTFCTNLLEAYQDARDTVDVAARLEIRVPLKYALVALMEMPDDVLRISLVSMKRSAWWNFRISRLHGATTLLAAMNQMPKEIRTELPTLQTYAGLCYFINGLHSRSLDDRTGRSIAKCVFPLTSNLQDSNRLVQPGELLTTDDSLEGVPYAPGGLAWLRHIAIPPELDRISFPISRPIDPTVFKRFFGVDEQRFRERITGKPKQTKPSNARHGTRLPPMRQTLEKVLGKDLPPSSAPNTSEENEGEAVTPTYVEPTEAKIDRLFSMYLINILEVLGASLKEREDYLIPSLDERQGVVLADFQTPSLGHIFSRFQWMKGSLSEWRKQFNRFFPDKDFKFGAKVIHHYSRLTYREEWIDWMATLTDKEAKKIKAAIFQKFNTLAWIPHAQGDRVWKMLENRLDILVTNNEALTKAPRILWSPHRQDTPTLSVTRVIQPRFEEEEEESDEEEQANSIPNENHPGPGVQEREEEEEEVYEDFIRQPNQPLPEFDDIGAKDMILLDHLVQPPDGPAESGTHVPQEKPALEKIPVSSQVEWYHDHGEIPVLSQYDQAVVAHLTEHIFDGDIVPFTAWDSSEGEIVAEGGDDELFDDLGSEDGTIFDRSSLPPEDMGEGFSEAASSDGELDFYA